MQPLTHAWFRRFTAVAVAILGLRDLGRGAAPLVIWPDLPQGLDAYFDVVAGVLLVALGVALWIGRGIRPLVVASLPMVVVASGLGSRRAIAEHGLDPLSGIGLAVWAGFTLFTVVAILAARWMWREASRAAP